MAGLSSARNYGLKYATGDYVWFVDGDDYIANNAVEILQQNLLKNQNDILCFNYYEVREKKMLKRYFKSTLASDELKNYIISVPSAWSRVYRRTFLDNNKISFKEGVIYEDVALTPSLVCYTDKIGYIENYLYYYIIRNNSIMHTKKFKANRDDKFIALETLEERIKYTGKLEVYKNELEYLYIKHLLIMYSTEILIYSKDIYKSRLERALNVINENYPNWEKNIYLRMEPIYKRMYLKLIKYKLYFFAVIANKFFLKVHNA